MILTVKASIITILLTLRLPLGIVFRSKVNHLYPIFCPDLIRGINRLSKHSHVDQIFGAWLLREMHHCQIDSEIPLYFPPCAVRVIFAVIHVKIGAHLPSMSKKTKSSDRWQNYMVSENALWKNNYQFERQSRTSHFLKVTSFYLFQSIWMCTPFFTSSQIWLYTCM